VTKRADTGECGSSDHVGRVVHHHGGAADAGGVRVHARPRAGAQGRGKEEGVHRLRRHPRDARDHPSYGGAPPDD